MARTVNWFYFEIVLRELEECFDPIPIEKFRPFLSRNLGEIASCSRDRGRAENRDLYRKWRMLSSGDMDLDLYDENLTDDLMYIKAEFVDKTLEVMFRRSDAETKVFESNSNLLLCAVYSADVQFAKVAYRYVDVPRRVCSAEFKNAQNTLAGCWTNLFRHRYDEDEFFTDEMASCYARIFLEELRAREGSMRSRNVRGFRRILLTVAVIKSVLLDLSGDASLEDHVRCVRMYFRAIPDPFVSGDDVREFLVYAFGEELDEASIERMTSVYEALFRAESAAPYAPRSLRHLCRCSVRRTLSEVPGRLTEHVRTLPLPRLLKDLLVDIDV